MQKILRITGWSMATVILLFILAALALSIFVKPNDFKSTIIKQVDQYTGRQLTLNGDIKWSFFPWIGIEINQAQLSNPKDFATGPFAQIKQIDVKVKLLPLLHERIAVGTIILDGLELNLIKNAKGVSNWQDLSKQNNNSNQTTTNQPSSSAS